MTWTIQIWTGAAWLTVATCGDITRNCHLAFYEAAGYRAIAVRA